MRRYIPLGMDVTRPVGIVTICPGRMIVGVIAVASYPIDSAVALDGMVAEATSRLIFTVSENCVLDAGVGRYWCMEEG